MHGIAQGLWYNCTTYTVHHIAQGLWYNCTTYTVHHIARSCGTTSCILNDIAQRCFYNQLLVRYASCTECMILHTAVCTVSYLQQLQQCVILHLILWYCTRHARCCELSLLAAVQYDITQSCLRWSSAYKTMTAGRVCHSRCSTPCCTRDWPISFRFTLVTISKTTTHPKHYNKGTNHPVLR